MKNSIRKPLLGCLGTIFIGATGLVFMGGLEYVLDYIANPWAHSVLHRPTLPGAWVGQVTSATGQSRIIYLDLLRSTGADGGYATCKTCPRIEGTAKMCGDGAVREYEVWGGPDTWNGTRFHLNYPRIKGTPTAGLQIGSIKGMWVGNELDLSMKFGLRNERADVSDITNPDMRAPVRFTMHRGSEADFEDRCRKPVVQPSSK